MLIEVLGPLGITYGHEPVYIPGGKLRALLATLALSPGEVVSVPALLDELWGETPPRTAANTLHGHIARLRRTLVAQTGDPYAQDVVCTYDAGYMLGVESENVDSFRFTRVVELAAGTVHSDPQGSITRLEDALRMWHGVALSDAGSGIMCSMAAVHLEGMKAVARELLVEAKLELGLHREVVPELELLLRQYPLRERFAEQLMLALYRSGRQADAVGVYHALRRRLDDDLGLDPGPGVRGRLAEILRQEPSLLA